MGVERTFRCDGPECERHAVTVKEMHPAFFRVTQELDRMDLHFCGWDCVLRYAGQQEPEIVGETDE